MRRGAYYFLAVAFLACCLWLVPKISLPQFIQKIIQWVILVGWIMVNEWVPWPPCTELTVLAIILYLAGSIALHLQYRQVKGTLEKEERVPHMDSVNKLCDWFIQATEIFQLAPWLFGGVYSAILIYTEQGESLR